MTTLARPASAQHARFSSAAAMIAAWAPTEPVFCISGAALHQAVRRFSAAFAGKPVYAVKVNPEPAVLAHLYAAGITDFDTASIEEIALIRQLFPDARCYYMAPIRPLGAAATAYRHFGVRDFALDCGEELQSLTDVVSEPQATTLYVRLSAPSKGAMFELSSKFGATTAEAARLVNAAAAAGFRVGLTFHVGSQCMDPAAYGRALDVVGRTLVNIAVPLSVLDIGGGFPTPYPGLAVPPLQSFFAMIDRFVGALGLPADCQLIAEPGRVLVADGVSLVTQVMLRKDVRLFLNDGVYGSLMEAKLPGSAVHYPTRAFRRTEDGQVKELTGTARPFTIFGPTCDAYDVLSRPYSLPDTIATGDFIEFGLIGAYASAMRTHFNGFYTDQCVEVDGHAP